MTDRTYHVIRNVRDQVKFSRDEVFATNLPHAEARAMADRLNREETAKKPHESSWTHDVFFIERIDPQRPRQMSLLEGLR